MRHMGVRAADRLGYYELVAQDVDGASVDAVIAPAVT